MNIKKLLILRLFFIFGLSFVTHNIYEWIPSFTTSVFFSVNESIWEHQKMIFTTTLIWGIIEYIILKRNKMNCKNVISSVSLSAIFNIIIFLIIYTPIYIIFGHNLIITLIIYFITIALASLVEYVVLSKEKHLTKLNVFALIIILFIYILFGILTYYPLKIESLFYDRRHGVYGLE